MSFFDDVKNRVKLLSESTRSFLDPPTLNAIEKPFEIDTKKLKNKTTEFGSEEEDIKDAQVVESNNFLHPFLTDTIPNDTDELIINYRKMSQLSYVSTAIDEIVNDAVLMEEEENQPVKIGFTDSEDEIIPKKLKEKIDDSFTHILNLFNFNDDGNEIFRQWFVDGRLLTQIILPEDKNEIKRRGITGLKIMSPLNLKRKYKRKYKDKPGKYFWVYDSKGDVRGVRLNTNQQRLVGEIPDELVVQTSSGKYDIHKKISLSYLHTAMKDINRLDVLEDHMLIYRIVRAPKRRVFYIDPMELPPKKAQAHLKNIMAQYRQNKIYNAETGAINAKTAHRSMLEDIFLLRKDGRGTEIATVGDSAGSLGEIQDLEFFQRSAFRALKVPFARINFEDRANRGMFGNRLEEITREEVRFGKYINTLRKKFNHLFIDLLGKHLVWKGDVKEHEWKEMKTAIKFIYKTDLQWVEAKELDNLERRLDLLDRMDEHIGKWVSRDFIHKTIFRRTDSDIKKFRQILQEEEREYQEGDGVQ